jgi:hypothetical protein
MCAKSIQDVLSSLEAILKLEFEHGSDLRRDRSRGNPG